MPHKLICGPAGSGKTTRAISAFGEALDAGLQPVFIAPGQPDVRHFQRSILREARVLSGTGISTFGWFIANAAGNAAAQRRRVSGIEQQLILRAAVQGAGKLDFLAASSRYEGFIRALGELVAELQATGVTPSGFAEACQGLLPHNLNADLFKVYSEYLDILEQQGLIDSEMEYRQAIASLEKDPGPLASHAFIVDGFHDFTGLQLELLELVAAHASDLVVTLPFVEGSTALRASAGFYETMSSWPGSKSEFLEAPDRGKEKTDIDHLNGHLFTDGFAVAPWQGTVKFLEGAGTRGQAELIAAEILRLLREGVAGLDDIVVVCRSLGSDARAIVSVFEEYGIPYDYGGRLPLRDSPVGQAAIALLDYLSAMAGSGKAPGSDGSAGDCLVRFLRRAAPGSGRVDEFAREIKLHGIDDPVKLRQKWEEIGGWPLRELEALEAAVSDGIAGLAAGLEAAITNITRRDLARSSEHSIGAEAFGGGFARGSEILPLVTVLGVLREAAALPEIDSDPAYGAVALLREAIASAMLNLPFGNRRGCVRVVDPHRIMNQEFDAVFICGLLEKQFPAARRVDPFIGDDARRQLITEQGIGLELSDRDAWIDEERFLFHRTVTRARRRLFLCHPYCDSQGGANVASIFLDEVKRLFKELPVAATRHKRISDITFDVRDAPTTTAALHAFCREAGNMHTGRKKIPAGVLRKIKQAAAPAGIDDRLDRCLEAIEPPGFRPGDYIRDHYSGEDSFSATALQNYTSCPFAFFVERGLRPAPMELDTFFLDRGHLAHAALAAFGSAMHRSGVVLWRADKSQLAGAHEQMDRQLDEAAAREGLGGTIDARVMIATLRYNLHRFVDAQSSADSELVPELFEYGFGGVKPDDEGSSGGSDAAPILGGWVRLRGVIDRIDVKPDTIKAAVVDYKTNYSTAWGSWLEKGEIQIPLYLIAAKAMGFEVVGGGYYSLFGKAEYSVFVEDAAEIVGSRLKDKNAVTGGELDRLLEEAERVAVKAAEGIRTGAFHMTDDPQSCKNCDYKGICRG